MKKVKKVLGYFLCYIAMAAITAVGVILFNPSSPTTNMRPTTPEIETSFITDAITQLTANQNYNLKSEINIKQENMQDIKLLLDLTLNTRNAFSEIDASGTIEVCLDSVNLTVGLILSGSDLFLDIDGNKLHLTTNNLVDSISTVMGLLGIDSPAPTLSLEDFDMSMIATLFTEYKEFDSDGEKSVSFNIFGIDVSLNLDDDHNITNIIVPSIIQGGMEIELTAELNKLESNQVEAPVVSDYQEGEFVSKLLSCLKNLTQNNFIEFIASIDYGSDINFLSQTLKFNAQVDLKNLQTTITSNSFGDIASVTYAEDTVFTQFGDIKVRADTQYFSKLFELFKTAGIKLGELDIPQINDVLSAVNKYLGMLNVNIDTSSLTLDQITQMIALICEVEVYEDVFVLSIDGASMYIMTEEDSISQIIINAGNLSVTLSDIKNTGEISPKNKRDYIDFAELYPTLESAINTATEFAWGGKLYFKNDIRDIEFDYSASLKDGSLQAQLSTSFGGKLLSLNYSDNTIYLAVDGIKMRANYNDIIDLSEWLSSCLGFELNLPDPGIINQLTLKDISARFITEIKPAINGVSVSFENGMHLTLNHSNGQLSNISVISGSISLCLSINTNDITVAQINKDEYIDYSVIKEEIDKLSGLARSQNLKISGQFSFDTEDTVISANTSSFINTKTFNSFSTFEITINEKTYNLSLYYNDGVFYVTYGEYNLSVSADKIKQLFDFITDTLPKYYDYSALTEGFSEYIELLKNPQTLLDNVPTDTASYISMIEEYLAKIESLTLLNDGSLVLTVEAGGQTLTVDMSDNITFGMSGNFVSVSETAAFNALPASPSDFLDADNFIDLVGTIEATVNKKTLALDVSLGFDDHTLEAAVDIDFRDSLKISITSNSLGSPLSVTYINKTLYLMFGELKISCTLSQLDEILNYAQNELFDTLTNMDLEVIDNLLTQITDAFENTKELTPLEIYNTLKGINFGDTISGTFRDINFELVTEGGKISDIYASDPNFSVGADIVSRDISVSAPQNCTDWNNLFPSVKALINTAAHLTVSGYGEISVIYNGYNETFAFDYTLSFVGGNLVVQLSAQLYEHNLVVTLQDDILFIQLDEVKLQSTYDDIKELMAYINEKFGVDIQIPDQLIDAARKISLSDISLGFITDISANGKTLTLNFGSNIMLRLANQDGLISEITFIYSDLSATLFVNQVSGITPPDIEETSRSSYLRYTELTKYINELSQLIGDFENEETDQYSFSGKIELYEADLNYAAEENKARDNDGMTYGTGVYENATSSVQLDLHELAFDLFGPGNLLLEKLHINISASGQGTLYDQWVRYPQNFETWYYSDPQNPDTLEPGSGHLYLNTNGLKGQMNKINIKEVFETIKSALPHYLDTTDFQEILDSVMFNENDDMRVDLQLAGSGMEISDDLFTLLNTYAPLIKNLSMDSLGKITLDLDIGGLIGKNRGENIVTIEIQFNGERLQLDLYGLKIGEGLYLNLSDITVDTVPSISSAPADPANYMDFSTLAGLLGEIDDTIQTSFNTTEQSYNFGLSSGSYININLNAYNIAGCELRLTIQNAEFKLHSDGSFEAMVSLTLPGKNVTTVFGIGVQNINEPSNANTNTTNHSVKLYITDRLEGKPMIYVDRTTTYKTGGFLGWGAKNVTDYIKARHDASNMDMFTLIQDICGFTDSIMEQFRTETEYIEGPMKIENVVENYTYTKNGNSKEYRVDFDLQQLTLVKMMNPYDSTYYTHLKATTSLKNDKYLLNNLFFDKIRINAKSGALEAKVDVWGNIALDQNKYGIAHTTSAACMPLTQLASEI